MTSDRDILLRALVEMLQSDGGQVTSRTVDRVVKKAPKKKRKASRYNKEYAKQYAKLKKKHPRTSFSVLAKKAHAATKRALK